MITKDEYCHRVIGRIEGMVKREFSIESFKPFLLSMLEEQKSSSYLHSDSIVVKLLNDKGEEFLVPGFLLLVDGYNNFDIQKEFKSEY